MGRRELLDALVTERYNNTWWHHPDRERDTKEACESRVEKALAEFDQHEHEHDDGHDPDDGDGGET